jgi:hypothetical protein
VQVGGAEGPRRSRGSAAEGGIFPDDGGCSCPELGDLADHRLWVIKNWASPAVPGIEGGCEVRAIEQESSGPREPRTKEIGD